MTGPPLRVIKLGGSLLDWSQWVREFRRWLNQQPTSTNVIVVGGGAFAEQIRRVDHAHTLPAETAHWLAVDAMSQTATIAAELLGDAVLVQSIEELQLSGARGCQILDIRAFLLGEKTAADALPCSWDVTSDSIAARVAARLGASELVLLKSTLPRAAKSIGEWSAQGFVDAHFPRAAAGMAVRCVNLRAPELSQIVA